jgi:hypothetical protein
MRKTAIALLALGLTAAVAASPAGAVSLLSETFTYANGDLTTVSGGNWAAHSGAASLPVQVTGGSAVLAQGAGSREDVNRTFAAQTATSSTYACFQLTVPDPGVAVTTTYFAHFKDTGTINFAGRVFVVASGAGYTVGLSATSSTVGATWASQLTYGVQYTVAVKYDAAAGSAQLWVNPTSELSTSISAAGGATGTVVSAFAFRQAGGNTGQVIDNLQVGTSFEDTCPNPTPTNGTTWGRLKTLYR